MKIIEIGGEKFELVGIVVDAMDGTSPVMTKQALYALKPLSNEAEGGELSPGAEDTFRLKKQMDGVLADSQTLDDILLKHRSDAIAIHEGNSNGKDIGTSAEEAKRAIVALSASEASTPQKKDTPEDVSKTDVLTTSSIPEEPRLTASNAVTPGSSNKQESHKYEVEFEQQQEISEIMEGFKNNPSNSNKYRHNMYAYVEDLVNQELARKVVSDE